MGSKWLTTRTCKECGATGSHAAWPRYAKNGRLSNFCSTCHAQNEERLKRSHEKLCQRCGQAPAVLNSQCRACDHIYKRAQREREAKAQGREYIPHDVQVFQSAMAKAEREADRLRARWAAAYLRPFRVLSKKDLAAYQRSHYNRHRIQELHRGQRYKLDNPARKAVWDSVRKLREADQSDGSVTRLSIARMKRGARLCAYCGCTLHHKQTDHMIPLALGGEHSLRNFVIVCPDCNQRKHALSYEEWIERVDPKHRDHVVALMETRYGVRINAA